MENEETYNEYRISRNKTKAACRKAIIEFEKKLARDKDKNPKAFYSYVKSNRKNKEAFPDIQYNNIFATTDLYKALFNSFSLFNSFFADTFSNKKITATPPFDLTYKNVNPQTNNIDLRPENIETYLKSLNSSKSPGPDALHPIIFKKTCFQMSKHLSTIFNKVLESGSVPQIWKEATTTPIFKKGDRSKALNYRPITYGINGSILYWIKNFLKNRRKRVVVNGNYSNWVPVKSGVPQGSVFSALLFIIYVNDIPEVIKSKAALFADGTKIFRSIENTQFEQKLQNDIDALVTWSQKWEMKFNIDKCSLMHLGNNNKSHTCNIHDPEKN
ncbi:uncharacterized protein LOC136091720 [Hydra vulgaris]|uniref:Uncharacterized protein LOC136091720 n=1 Tax=Hydra vulgaris TaxID=6087 RepID=A0ABM4DLS8_HYDVU